MTTLIDLPRRTSHTLAGPVVNMSEGFATVRYDTTEEGETKWTEVTFSDVLRVEYTAGAVCVEEDVIGPDYIVAETAAADIQELEARWNTSVGWHETVPRPPITRYRLYFDDAASLVVIARGVSIDGEPVRR